MDRQHRDSYLPPPPPPNHTHPVWRGVKHYAALLFLIDDLYETVPYIFLYLKLARWPSADPLFQ